MNHLSTVLTCALFAGTAPALASDGTPPTSVEVKGVRDPVLQPYRIMAAGFDAMEKHRALAPAAQELRFRLSARKSAPAGVMDGLALRIEGENTALAVPLDGSHAFTLPRSETALEDNAKLNLNRKQNYIRWVPEIRTPGVAPGFIRLGDARMECQVIVGIVKKVISMPVSLTLSGFMRTTDWCSAEHFKIPTFTARQVASATLLHGEERIALQVDDDGKGFFAPLREMRYGHDDLIEVVYAGEQ